MSTAAADATIIHIEGIPGIYAQHPTTGSVGIQTTEANRLVDAGREAALVQLSKMGQIIEYLKVLYR